ALFWLPKVWLSFLCLGNGAILSIPVGMLTLFSFILWFRVVFRRRPGLHISESLKREIKGWNDE
ncbi:MAG TPA: hypothetical protein VJ728_00725, partial [Candidatus Binataceae bacterium]|nr:hypothetical protein [Candidatus Binataceae bacterium]